MYFFYNTAEQIRQAKELRNRYGKDILRNKKCSSMLKKLNAAIEDSRKLMKELGVVDICSACANEKPGGCCHFGIETCYTDMIILMNLLLGVNIPEQRALDKNCLFVNKHGCQLKVRLKTCIYHLCPKITDSLKEYDLFRLRATNSHEIKSWLQAETAVRDFIRIN